MIEVGKPIPKGVGAEIREGLRGAGVHCRAGHQASKGDAVKLILLLAVQKKKVLFFRIGPPMEPPNWFKLNFSAAGAKKLLASSAVLRKTRIVTRGSRWCRISW